MKDWHDIIEMVQTISSKANELRKEDYFIIDGHRFEVCGRIHAVSDREAPQKHCVKVSDDLSKEFANS